jgi:hypothetical protein
MKKSEYAEMQQIVLGMKLFPSEEDLLQFSLYVRRVKNWGRLLDNLVNKGLAPLFYEKIVHSQSETAVPAQVVRTLQQTYYRTLSRNVLLYEYFSRIINAFERQKIVVIALKGVYLSEWLYKNIAFRQFSDIDLLIHKDDALYCVQILKRLGFKAFLQKSYYADPVEIDIERDLNIYLSSVHLPPMVLGDVSVELHINIHKPEFCDLPIDALWDNSNIAVINGVSVNVLNLNYLLLHLLLHLDQHYKKMDTRFTCFTDVYNLVCCNEMFLDWAKLEEIFKQYKCEYLFKYCILIKKYIKFPFPKVLNDRYAFLVSEKDFLSFKRYLKNSRNIEYRDSIVRMLHQKNGVYACLKYFLFISFPPKKFMLQRYGIKNNLFYVLYYVYRLINGFFKEIRV